MGIEEKLVVALDFQSVKQAVGLIDALANRQVFYKIGLGMLARGGLQLAEQLVRDDYHVFMDMKLFDIGQTVYDAALSFMDLGVRILTVHGDPTVVRAAMKAKHDGGYHDCDIYAVTVLTSLNSEDLKNAGYVTTDVRDCVLHRVGLAMNEGVDGIIASGQECAEIKKLYPKLKVITPGIRLPGDQTHDQKRIVSPAQAISDGAEKIVVGRPITRSAEPQMVMTSILEQIGTVSMQPSMLQAVS